MSGGRSSGLRLIERTSLGEHASAWDELVAVQPVPSPFLRSWWVNTATRRRPVVLLAFDGDELVGGLALEEDRRMGLPRLRVLGSDLAPDHIDLVAAPGRVADVAELVGGWFARKRARYADLACLAWPSRLVTAIGPRVTGEVVDRAPYTPLLPDFSAFLASRPSQLRNSLDRAQRRVRRAGSSYRRVTGSDCEQALAILRQLHGESFGQASAFLPHFASFEAVARAGSTAGELVFHQLWADSAPVATVVTFETTGRVSYYQAGRSLDHQWRGAGVALESCLIERACTDGFREFDHLRGMEPYKLAWAPHTRDLGRAVFIRGAVTSAAVRTLRAVARRPRPPLEVANRARQLARRNGG